MNLIQILQFLGFLIALITFCVSLATNINKFSNTVAKLTVSVENLQKVVEELKSTNSLGHKRIWEKNEEQDKKLNAHENRLSILENQLGDD